MKKILVGLVVCLMAPALAFGSTYALDMRPDHPMFLPWLIGCGVVGIFVGRTAGYLIKNMD